MELGVLDRRVGRKAFRASPFIAVLESVISASFISSATPARAG